MGGSRPPLLLLLPLDCPASALSDAELAGRVVGRVLAAGAAILGATYTHRSQSMQSSCAGVDARTVDEHALRIQVDDAAVLWVTESVTKAHMIPVRVVSLGKKKSSLRTCAAGS